MVFYKVLRFMVAPFYAMLYPTKIVGKENLVNGKAIYICNHYTMTDPIIIACRLFKKEFHVLVKKEAFKKRFVKWLLGKLGGIPVDRGNADIQSYKAVVGLLKNDKNILIFPEGTRNKEDSHEIQPIKNGVSVFSIKTESIIVPMQFYKAPKLFRKNYLIIGKPIDLSCYYGKKVKDNVKQECCELITASMNDLRDEVDKLATKNKQKQLKG